MLKRMKKVALGAMTLVFAVCVSILCLQGIKDGRREVSAASTPTVATLTTDKTSVPAGGSFTLTMTLTSSRGGWWAGCTMFLAPLTADGVVDKTLAAKLSAADITLDSKFNAGYGNDSVDSFQETRSALEFQVSCSMRSNVPTSTPMVLTAKITVASDLTNVNSIKFGFREVDASHVLILDSDGATTHKDTMKPGNNLSCAPIEVGITVPSSDTTLSELKMGPAGNLTTVALPSGSTSLEYTLTSGDKNILIQPTANDGATIKVGLTNPPTQSVASGSTSTPLSLQAGVNTVYIEMTAEDGTKATYQVTVKMAYARLTSLTVVTTSTTAGVTRNGLAETFDKDKFAYDVYVPSDSMAPAGGISGSQGVTIRATVESGYGTDTSYTTSPMGCTAYPAGTSIASGANLIISRIQFGSKVELVLTASDRSTQKYTLQFVPVSVNANISSLKVAGVDTGTEYENKADKATEKGVDYYFALEQETQFKGTMKLSLSDTGASATVEGQDYSDSREYEMNTYTVVVTAEAGNTKTYKVMISGPQVLELLLTSNYEFLTEEEVDDEGDLYYYRRTYTEKGWKHGVDDKDLERYVLGQISPETTINEFLTNFATTQYPMIRIYDVDGTLLYDRGSAGADIEAGDLDDVDMYRICTGTKIEFGTGTTVLETVYCSVLGDVNKDGYIGSTDASTISMHVRRISELNTVELRLAAYIGNSGTIGSTDASNISMIVRRLKNVEDFYYKAS